VSAAERDPSWDPVHEGVTAVVDRWDAALARHPDPSAAERSVRDFLVDELLRQAGGGPQRDHALFMFMVVERLAKAGRFADAFTVLDWIAEVYAGQRDPGLAAPAVLALTDWAVDLLANDPGPDPDPARALGLLNRAADRVAPGADPAIQRAACRALAQVALLRSAEPVTDGDEGVRRLIEPWRVIVRRWAGHQDGELRFRLSQAHFNIGLIRLQLGETGPAGDSFADSAALSGTPADQGFSEEYAGPAGLAGRVLSAVDLPDAAVIEEALLTGDAAKSGGWAERRRRRRDAERLLEQARRRHRTSVGRVRAWSCGGEPFALLLRNFDLLEWTHRAEGDQAAAAAQPAQVFDFQRIGEQVVRPFAREVRTVQVAASRSASLELDPWRLHGAPLTEAQLYLADGTWLDTVRRLVALAETVVVWAETMTPALAQELTALREQGREADTVVLIEPADPRTIPRAGIAAVLATELAELRSDGGSWRDLADELMPRIRPPGEQLTPDAPELAGFPNVVDLGRTPPQAGAEPHPADLARLRQHADLSARGRGDRIARQLGRVRGG
jgi:hypothetical protein